MLMHKAYTNEIESPGCKHFSQGVLRGLWFVFVLVFFPGGCGKTISSSEDPLSKRNWPSFIDRTDGADCSLRCREIAESVVRSELGLDPTTGSSMGREPDEWLRSLTEGVEPLEGCIRRVSVGECVNRISVGAVAPCILVHETGHLYVLLGTIKIRGHLMCQLIHGKSPVWLVESSKLKTAGFREAWWLHRVADSFPVRIGAAKLRVDHMFHDFGEVEPQSRVQCLFVVKNTGERTVVIDKPRVSCGCITPNTTSVIQLAPGEQHELSIALRVGVSSSVRHAVALKCFEKETGDSKELVFYVFASQRQAMRIVPHSVDFGVVVPGQSYTRTIRLTEVASDRFEIHSVKVSGLPSRSQWQLVEKHASRTLHDYLVRLTITMDAQVPRTGDYAGELVVTTSSHVRPHICVPTRLTVPQAVCAEPSIISLGSVVAGEQRQARVRFISRSTESFSIDVARWPRECRIELDRSKVPQEMLVTC